MINPAPEGTDPWVVHLAAEIERVPELHCKFREAWRAAEEVFSRASVGGTKPPPKPFAWYAESVRRFARDEVRAAELDGDPLEPREFGKRFARWVSKPKDPALYVDDDSTAIPDPTAPRQSVNDWYAKHTGGAA